MSSASVSPSTTVSSSLIERFTGRVKWFNNKAGYGFITVTDGPKTGTDIFVHHSSIRVDAQQYKYLVQGEYTEFALTTVANSAHECQAADVSGIKSGKLMCETRMEARSTRTNYKSAEQPVVAPQTPVAEPAADWKPARKPRQQAAPRENKPTTSTRPSPSSETGGRGPSAAGRGSGTGGRGTGRGGRGAKRT